MKIPQIIDFSEGKFKWLSTKPEISGQGCNFQYHCNMAIFMGIGYKFNDFIQAVHRIYRFQQKNILLAHYPHEYYNQQIRNEVHKNH